MHYDNGFIQAHPELMNIRQIPKMKTFTTQILLTARKLEQFNKFCKLWNFSYWSSNSEYFSAEMDTG